MNIDFKCQDSRCPYNMKTVAGINKKTCLVCCGQSELNELFAVVVVKVWFTLTFI